MKASGARSVKTGEGRHERGVFKVNEMKSRTSRLDKIPNGSDPLPTEGECSFRLSLFNQSSDGLELNLVRQRPLEVTSFRTAALQCEEDEPGWWPHPKGCRA